MSVPTPQATVDDGTGRGFHRVERVVAPDVVIGEAGPTLLGQPVGLVDRGVDVDHNRTVFGTRSSRPGPSEQLARHLVELTNMAPGETAQEDPERRRRQHRMAQSRLGGSRPQCIGVVDRVSSGQCRVNEGHRLVPDVRPSRGVTEVDVQVEELAQTQMFGKRGRQDEARIGD